ncbi:MAG: T9SS type A sorting domain-containing protein, partial [Lewinella sp.]|nr:T9SS type A sorting domain-containing protein [Lewinella sp.]
VSNVTNFGNYFAYDDGTAEQGLVAQEGTEVAVEFEAGLPDTIRAVQFMHPRSNEDVSEQEFEILIWIGELDDSPEFSMTVNPYYADLSFDTIQGMTTYVLRDRAGELAPVAIPAGKFYVGWNQVTACTFNRCVPVGYDRNREEGANFTYVDVGQGWNLLDEPEKGSLMIRAVLGSQTPIATGTKEEIAEEAFVRIFPNPSRGTVNIRTLKGQAVEDQLFSLYDQSGRLIERGVLKQELDFNDLPSGLYLLQIQDVKSGKIQINRLSLQR